MSPLRVYLRAQPGFCLRLKRGRWFRSGDPAEGSSKDGLWPNAQNQSRWERGGDHAFREHGRPDLPCRSVETRRYETKRPWAITRRVDPGEIQTERC
jgi:hypothetical protein